jgi:UPF0042 nucleotide-binding protein
LSEKEKPRLVELALVTGLSGSGKSTVGKCFEDLGYHCVDNLPASLLRAFLLDPLQHVAQVDRVAVITDVRAPGIAQDLPALLAQIDPDELRLQIVFLEASDETLVRRFSETRRRHPLGGEQTLIGAIREERALMRDIRGLADVTFDTSEWSIHEVRRQIYDRFATEDSLRPRLVTWLTSFGFKYGVPYGTDLLFDVRFLANPYFDPELRELNGRNEKVLDFLQRDDEFPELLTRLKDFLLYLLPRYQTENRSYLSVSIGCTGGKHRSVAICERLSAELADEGMNCRIDHRDIDRS